MWVAFFNQAHAPAASHLEDLLNRKADLALSELILTEILQGIRDDTRFERVRRYLLDFPIVRPQGLDTFIHAAQLYRACQRRGTTVRKTVDCVIAAVVMEHGLELFHHDRDFDAIARCTPLAIYRPPQGS